MIGKGGMIMKRIILLPVLAGIFLFGCNSTKENGPRTDTPDYDAQGVVEEFQREGTPVSDPATDNPQPEEEVILGGFIDLALDSDYVTEAYAYLKKYLAKEFPSYTLKEPLEAQGQVVAGYKVKIICNYSQGDGDLKLRAFILFGLDETVSVLKIELPME